MPYSNPFVLDARSIIVLFSVSFVVDVSHCRRHLEPHHLFQFFQLALCWHGDFRNDLVEV